MALELSLKSPCVLKRYHEFFFIVFYLFIFYFKLSGGMEEFVVSLSPQISLPICDVLIN